MAKKTAKAPAKQPLCATAVIELKLGACLTGPTKRLAHDLHDIAYLCNVARMAIQRSWQRWREDNPDWAPGQRTGRDGQPKTTGAGQPVLEHPAYSQQCERDLYRVGCESAGAVNTQIVTACRNEILARLRARTPKDHAGRARFRWEALVWHELPLDCAREAKIPMPVYAGFCLGYRGKVSRPPGLAAMGLMQKHCDSSAVVRLPLFSGSAGREHAAAIVRVEVRQLSPGNRELLAKLAAAQWKLCDSFLAFKRDAWVLQLCYQAPAGKIGLSRRRVAHVWYGAADGRRPFRIEGPEKEGRFWLCGRAHDFMGEVQRLEARRREMSARYRWQCDGSRGRGFKRVLARTRPYERANPDAQRRFQWDLIAELVRFCRKEDCGRVVYHEPNQNLRNSADLSWFASRGVSFNWSTLRQRLEYKLFRLGIQLEVVSCCIPDWREKFGQKKPGIGA